ncbi:MAG: EamA family transporter [Candidatus Babeliales bacterium]
MGDEHIWIFLGVTSAFFAALVGIFNKLGVAHLDSTLAVMIYTFLTFLYLLLITIFNKKIYLLWHIDSQSLCYLFLSGLCGACSWLAYFFALKIAPISRISIIDRLTMIFLVLLSIGFGERFYWKTLIDLLIIMIGIIFIFLN